MEHDYEQRSDRRAHARHVPTQRPSFRGRSKTSLRPRFIGWSMLFAVPTNVVVLVTVAGSEAPPGVGAIVGGTTVVASALLVIAEVICSSGYDPFQ